MLLFWGCKESDTTEWLNWTELSYGIVGSSVNLPGQWTHYLWKCSGIKASIMFWFAYSVTGLTLNMSRLHDLWFWLWICKTECIWMPSFYGQSCSCRYNSGTGASGRGMELPWPFWVCHPSNTSKWSPAQRFPNQSFGYLWMLYYMKCLINDWPLAIDSTSSSFPLSGNQERVWKFQPSVHGCFLTTSPILRCFPGGTIVKNPPSNAGHACIGA